MRCLVWATGLVLCASCGEPTSLNRSSRPELSANDIVVAARVEPKNATELRAPQNTMVIGDWRSWGGWIKLVELAPDGAAVKAGDMVARFEHNGHWGHQWLQREIARAQADAENARLTREADLRWLVTEHQRRQLDLEWARLALSRAPVLSQRALEAHRLDVVLAEFEAQALQRRLEAGQRAGTAEEAYHRLNQERVRHLETVYQTFIEKFTLRAPHDGVIRHAYNSRVRRKLEKGDGVPAGTHVCSLARDDGLSVRVFVPEHLLQDLQIGTPLTILGLDDEEWSAKVTNIDPIPQRLAFLLQDDVPHGEERAYGVRADFTGDTEGISAGIEVRARLPRP